MIADCFKSCAVSIPGLRGVVAGACILLVGHASALSQQVSRPGQPATSAPLEAETSPAPRLLIDKPGRSESFSRLARLITLASLPREFEERKDWGKTAERWDGLYVWRDGLRIKTKRRKKEVNHGDWKMYRVRLLDPEEEFVLQVDNLRQTSDNEAACDVTVLARMAVFGRISKWQQGVQLYSFSADAECRVRLQLACRFALSLDPSKLPPDVIFQPAVTAAQADLIDFRLLRLSNLRGPLAKELGQSMKKIAVDKLKDQQDKIPQKINRQIAKNQEHLRLSLQDAIQDRWSRWGQEGEGEK